MNTDEIYINLDIPLFDQYGEWTLSLQVGTGLAPQRPRELATPGRSSSSCPDRAYSLKRARMRAVCRAPLTKSSSRKFSSGAWARPPG